jgi:exosortase F-associated protein
MESTAGHYQRIACSSVALAGLAGIYVFQYTDFLLLVSGHHFSSEFHFISNRMVRIFVNDSCMLALIYAIFHDVKVVRLAFYVQVIDLLVLFPLYLIMKLPAEGVSEISSPFLAQIHRLIINPTLMILLIAGVYYQKVGAKSDT